MKLTQAQKQKIKELAQKYKLKLVLVFGSQVGGRLHKESDVDIAILPKENLTFEQEIYLSTDLINVLGENVDMTNLRKAPPLLMKEIIDNCKILYEKKNNIFDSFEVYALHRYAEAGPIFKMHQEAVNRFIKNDL